VEAGVLALYPDASISRALVPDEAAAIRGALVAHDGVDFILTTGGTGLSPRDITPEVTMAFCDRPIPGIAETLRALSYRETPTAMLSRAYAGVHGTSIVVNLPGSVKAVKFCMSVLGPVMAHAVAMLHAEGHEKGGSP
jgi:molybdenum cofactor synthesis domain-containing protein